MSSREREPGGTAARALAEMQRHLDEGLAPGLYLVATPIGSLATSRCARYQSSPVPMSSCARTRGTAAPFWRTTVSAHRRGPTMSTTLRARAHAY